MKKILILAYIIGVLILSGMVKADVSGVGLVQSAAVTMSGVLTVDGIVESPCYNHPSLVVGRVDEIKRSLNLAVQTKVSQAVCVEPVKPFHIVFDLKTLPLQNGNEYSLDIQNYVGQKQPLTYKVETGEFGLFGAGDFSSPQTLKGILKNGTLQTNGKLIPLVSQNMAAELSSFQGPVQVVGYVVSIGELSGNSLSLAPSSQEQAPEQVIVPISVSQY